jgi:hypothetical protein
VKAVLDLELIGDDLNHLERTIKARDPLVAAALFPRGETHPRTWVARITGSDPTYGLARQFVRPTRDYSRANSIGSRGVRAYYVLAAGVYEVNQRTSWHNARRYFVRVIDDQITEISRDEVMACLSAS